MRRHRPSGFRLAASRGLATVGAVEAVHDRNQTTETH